MDATLGLLMGFGLSAACGFRVFVPLLGMSIAYHTGDLELAQGFEWIGSWPATFAFGIATLLEVGCYYISWLDNLMDSLTTPAAIVAGSIVSASMVVDMSPFLRWGLAIIAGGGAAGVIQVGSVITRGLSTATTGGVSNPVVSTGEVVASIVTTVLALFIPILAVIIIVMVIVWILKKIFLRKREEKTVEVQAAER